MLFRIFSGGFSEYEEKRPTSEGGALFSFFLGKDEALSKYPDFLRCRQN